MELNASKLNYSPLNVSGLNRAAMNGTGMQGAGGDGGTVVIPNCLLLEDGGAMLWEDGTPALIENLPLLKKRIKTE